MISILKKNDDLIIWCTKNEKLDIKKIRDAISTIKKMNRNSNMACKLILKNFNLYNFSRDGFLFYNRIVGTNKFINGNISIIKIESNED